MTFLLKDIELQLDDFYIEQAENLLREGALLSMEELEKHLWVFKVRAGQIFEVEVQITPSRVKAMSCECATFKEDKICAHIAAALLSLRSLKKKNKEKKKQELISKRQLVNNSKLTTNKILENVSQEELAGFIRYYSKSNRNFSLALKAFFAGVVPSIDSREKYRHLLETSLKAISREGAKISPNGAKQIISLIRQFLRHTEEAEARNDFAEVAAILEVVFDKSGLILSRMEKHKEQLVELLKKFLIQLGNLLNREIAPSLKSQLWSHLFSKMGNGSYKKYGLAVSFIQTLLPYSKSLHANQQLLDFIDQQLEEPGLSERQQIELIMARFSILEESGLVEEAYQYLNQHSEKPEILMKIIEQSIKSNKLKVAEQLAESAMKKEAFQQDFKQFRDYLLEIAVKTGKKAKIVKLALIQYLEDYEDLYYEILRKQRSWSKIFADLLKELDRRPYSIKKRDAIAKLLIDNRKFDSLIEYIEQIKSIDLLMKYDRILIKSDRKKIIELYEYLLSDYLSNHLGRQSAQKVQNIIQHLFSSKEAKLASKFVERIRKEYSERHSLIEELEIFQ